MLPFHLLFLRQLPCFRQCQHTIPAVCMTRVGAGLNLMIDENDQKKLFTVDLVPSYKVEVPQDFGELQLRQVRQTFYKLGETYTIKQISYYVRPSPDC